MVATITEERPVVATIAPLPVPRHLNYTDMGNARRFADAYAAKLRYVHGRDCWLIWDGTRWGLDKRGAVMRLAKLLVRKMYKDAGIPTNDNFDKKLAEWAIKCEARQRLENIIALAKSEPEIAVNQEQLDCNPWLLNCKNCTIDLRTLDTKKHDPKDLITRRIEVNYDPNAQAPNWRAFLDRIFGKDAELISFMRRAVGYTLTGVIAEHVLFFMLGNGRNGKSTFIETIIDLLDEYSVRLRTESLTINNHEAIPNDIAALLGARLCVTDETEQDQRMAEKLVKALTGGDQIRARFLRQEFFTFKPSHKLWMFGNHKLGIRGTDTAIWARIRLIPFNVTISDGERDLFLRDKLRNELPGILAWAVRGASEWQISGLGTCSAIVNATDAYRREMDAIGDWIESAYEKDPTGRVSVVDLYTSYTTYMEDSGERAISRRRLGIILRERGIECVRSGSNGSYQWKGLKQKKETTPF